MFRYFIIYKPYQVLSQFSFVQGKQTLKDICSVPPDTYPIGRLDYDSEGLLILTNDKQLNHRLLHPLFRHEREYWVQVEGSVQEREMKKLQSGVVINVDGKPYLTKKCLAAVLEEAPPVTERNPPIRFRKSIPTTWIKLILREGKNRQVRKMTAAIGHPTLRLIRTRIEQITLYPLQPGKMKELTESEIYEKLFSKQ